MSLPPWTNDEIAWMQKSLEDSPRGTTLESICQRMSAALGRNVSSTNLTRAFLSRGRNRPIEYIGQKDPSAARAKTLGPLPPPPEKPLPEIADPVERQEREDRAKKLKREHGELLERLKEAEHRQKILDRLAAGPAPTPKILRREKTGVREATAVALASDWHVEENVYPAAVAGRNEYNLEIADKRVSAFFRGVRSLTDFSRNGWHVRDLILWLGGDLITGNIHEELEEDNDLSPIEAILWLRERLVNGIGTLLADKKLERLIVPCSYGNHGRTTKKRRIKTGAKNSYEWLLYQWLAAHYADEPRVTFTAEQSAHQYVDVYEQTAHFHHGDELTYMGGAGGLSIPLNKRIPKWDNVRESAFHFIGHFHQYLDLGHTLVNGSLIGYSEYAFAIGAEFEPPRQAFCLIDAKLGKCMNAPIWVEAAA